MIRIQTLCRKVAVRPDCFGKHSARFHRAFDTAAHHGHRHIRAVADDCVPVCDKHARGITQRNINAPLHDRLPGVKVVVFKKACFRPFKFFVGKASDAPDKHVRNVVLRQIAPADADTPKVFYVKRARRIRQIFVEICAIISPKRAKFVVGRGLRNAKLFRDFPAEFRVVTRRVDDHIRADVFAVYPDSRDFIAVRDKAFDRAFKMHFDAFAFFQKVFKKISSVDCDFFKRRRHRHFKRRLFVWRHEFPFVFLDAVENGNRSQPRFFENGAPYVVAPGMRRVFAAFRLVHNHVVPEIFKMLCRDKSALSRADYDNFPHIFPFAFYLKSFSICR